MDQNLNHAIELLKADDVVGIPTETVYGLAGRIDSEKALQKIFATKRRPFFDPLIVHVSTIEMAKSLVSTWPAYADKLAITFWPGPLTIVLPKNGKVSDLITSGLDSVGIRMPNHPLALKLIEQCGPLAAPSANLFTKTSPTKASHVIDEFQNSVTVVDGGDCEVGIESTVIGLFENEIKIYRPGMIDKAKIASIVGPAIKVNYSSSPVAPGQIKHHYMPRRPLVLCEVGQSLPDEFTNKKIALWKVGTDPTLVARNLYAKMRECDANGEIIVFEVIKEFYLSESWTGIRNRLEKAASVDLISISL